jgi:CDP-glycerol glycerophosphotransferase (TagB/SpsB family)
MFYKYKDLFKVPKYIEYGTNLQFQDLLVEADAIVTDFSSNAYEMAVIGKPCFYYIPDVKYVQENMKQYKIENFEKYSIGKLCNTQKELLDTLDLFADGKYEMSELNRRNINSTFDFIDDRNCERIYEFVKSIYNKPK